jgi:hypothetical protein
MKMASFVYMEEYYGKDYGKVLYPYINVRNRNNYEPRIKYIQLLFNRDIYLEELLDRYNINYDNSKVNLRVLKQSK